MTSLQVSFSRAVSLKMMLNSCWDDKKFTCSHDRTKV